MKYLLSILLLSMAMRAQNFTASSSVLPDAPSQQPFWTVENKVNVGSLAGSLRVFPVHRSTLLRRRPRSIKSPVLRVQLKPWRLTREQ